MSDDLSDYSWNDLWKGVKVGFWCFIAGVWLASFAYYSFGYKKGYQAGLTAGAQAQEQHDVNEINSATSTILNTIAQ